MGGEEFDGATDPNTVGFGDKDGVTPIMLGGISDIPSGDAMGCPGLTLLGCFMDDDAGTKGSKGGAVEVKGTIEVSFRGQSRVEAGGAEEIQGSGGLGEKVTPKVKGEKFVSATDDGDKMILEGLNGALGSVASVIVGWDELEVNAFLAEIAFEPCRGFVVEALMAWSEAAIDKVLVYFVERLNVFKFGPVAEGGGEYSIAIVHIAHEDVLVPLVGCYGKSACEIRGDFVVGSGDGREDQMGFGVGDIGQGVELRLGEFGHTGGA